MEQQHSNLPLQGWRRGIGLTDETDVTLNHGVNVLDPVLRCIFVILN